MEPWDGPAAIAFTNGRQIGATLDRNGLRPARYIVTRDDRIIMASEVGVLPIPEEEIVTKWRLQPGKMLLVDLEEGRLIPDEELKATLARSHPYREVARAHPDRARGAAGGSGSRADLEPLAARSPAGVRLHPGRPENPDDADGDDRRRSGRLHGQRHADLGAVRPPKLLFTYFKQNFAQVTNPPIDPIREELVMSLVSIIGPRPNLFDLEGASNTKRLEVHQPILTNANLEKIRSISEVGDDHFKSLTLDTTWPAETGAAGMEEAIAGLCGQAEEAVRDGINIIILSDRRAGADRIPIPSLLACAAVHHHLIREGLRTSVGLVVESGEPREVHHFACLAGYGAEAINPYLAFETLVAMKGELPQKLDEKEIVKRYIKSIDKGLLKVMSKMGISTYQSYCGAQIFDAVGLKSEFVAKYFTGTATRIEGVGVDEIAEEAVRRHRDAFSDAPIYRAMLDVGGDYAFRVRGEDHVWNAATVGDAAARGARQFVREVPAIRGRSSTSSRNSSTPSAACSASSRRDDDGRTPVPIEEVEPAKEIVKRFSTGAMSFGSISREAHTTLAIAMNRIGGKSNTGEGGEESDRFKPLPNGDSMRSAIKQVASGRFGVTAEYLVNSDMMQIKIAQGAKPGEGGQLPGYKVDKTIAKVRHSTPGVGLISPPPHHDIYSIEDLAQLIFDLKNVNPDGDVSVKLVSESRRRHRRRRRVEGALRPRHHRRLRGRHRRFAADLDQARRLALGDRACRNPPDAGRQPAARPHRRAGRRRHPHRPRRGGRRAAWRRRVRLRHRAADRRRLHHDAQVPPQHLPGRRRHPGPGAAQALHAASPSTSSTIFFFVAEEVRELMAAMGYRTFDEMIGQMQMLDVGHAWSITGRRAGSTSRRLFTKPDVPASVAIYNCEQQDHKIHDIIDRKLIAQSQAALERGAPVRISLPIRNTDRTTGAMLSGEIAKRYGHDGLPHDTIVANFNGTAGQSFGAFLARGVTFELEGDANDYVGKGLSGGRIVVRPPAESGIVPEQSIIVGNTVLYGAIEGECYFRGVAGERFAVRNSGAIAVIEGAGDHCCEYMTGGVVVVLGRTGRNFAAGMSGGIAYVLDEDGTFASRCNLAMVELEPMPSEEDINARVYPSRPRSRSAWPGRVMADMSRFDAQRLHHLISRHARFTGSALAAKILADWKTLVSEIPQGHAGRVSSRSQRTEGRRRDAHAGRAE